MRTTKKLWSILLVLALVVSLMAGAFTASAAEGAFEPDTALQNGREYVIVTESDGKYFALNKGESGLGAEEVTVADGKIAEAPDTAIWIAHVEEITTVESLASPGSYIFAGSGGFMTYTGGRAFEYDGETKTIALHGAKYYMTFTGTTFDQGTQDQACTVMIFGRGDVVEVEEKGKLEFPQPASTVKSAVKNDDGSINLAFTSDVHYDGKNLNLKTWLEAAEADVGFIDSMGTPSLTLAFLNLVRQFITSHPSATVLAKLHTKRVSGDMLYSVLPSPPSHWEKFRKVFAKAKK